MKRLYIILATIAAVLVSCHHQVAVMPVANFNFTTEHPFTVVLTNNSTSATSYEWDFGDGTYSTDKSPKHRYATKGVYKITLTVKSVSGRTSSTSKNVTLEAPSKIYISGFTYNSINKNNEYYKIKVIDDDFFTTTWVNTNWELLSSANMPYSYMLATPKLMDGLVDDNYYDVQVYRNTKSSGDGTKVASIRIATSKIYNYPTEIAGTNNGCGVTVHFSYK